MHRSTSSAVALMSQKSQQLKWKKVFKED